MRKRSQLKYTTVFIKDKPFKLLFDDGAEVNIISTKLANAISQNTLTSSTNLGAFNSPTKRKQKSQRQSSNSLSPSLHSFPTNNEHNSTSQRTSLS